MAVAIDYHLLALKRQDVPAHYALWGWDPATELRAIFEDWWLMGHGVPDDKSSPYPTLLEYAQAIKATTTVDTAPAPASRTTVAATPGTPVAPLQTPNLTRALASMAGVKWQGEGDPALLAAGLGALFLMIFKYRGGD